MKAAVIGLGPHGRRMMEALGRLPEVHLHAVVDRDEAVLKEFAQRDIACYRSAEQMLDGHIPDLVCIATNGPSHAAIAIAAIERGVRRILLAKPLACSLTEGDRILQAASAAGTRVAVDHIRRHSPIYCWLRERIADGGWGTLRCLWIQRPGIGLACNATHSFDLFRFLSGQQVRRVTGWVDEPLAPNPRGADFLDPGGLVVLECDGNCRAAISQIEDGAGPTSVEIDLTGARVRFDEKSGHIEIIRRDLAIKPGPGRPPAYQSVELPSNISTRIDMIGGLHDAISNLLTDEPLKCDVSHGMAAIEILIAAHLSARRENRPVVLSEITPEDRELWLPVT